MYHRTAQKLLTLTDLAEFERLALDVLAAAGYDAIDPRTLVLVDGARDGLSYYCEATQSWVVFTLQRQWKTRYRRDMERALDTRRPVERLVFCTNRTVPDTEKDGLTKAAADYDIQLHFFDGERLRHALDTIATDVRATYLGLPDCATTRRLVRYALTDPENEWSPTAPDKLEALLPECRTARRLYELLRNEDLAAVCDSGLELRALTEVLDAYVCFRRSATALQSAVVALAKEGVAEENAESEAARLLREAWDAGKAGAPVLDARLAEAREDAVACIAAVERACAVGTLTVSPHLSADFPGLQPLPPGRWGPLPTSNGHPAPAREE